MFQSCARVMPTRANKWRRFARVCVAVNLLIMILPFFLGARRVTSATKFSLQVFGEAHVPRSVRNIFHVTEECEPVASSGTFGNIVRDITTAQSGINGSAVTVIMPKYRFETRSKPWAKFSYYIGAELYNGVVHHLSAQGLTFLLVESICDMYRVSASSSLCTVGDRSILFSYLASSIISAICADFALSPTHRQVVHTHGKTTAPVTWLLGQRYVGSVSARYIHSFYGEDDIQEIHFRRDDILKYAKPKRQGCAPVYRRGNALLGCANDVASIKCMHRYDFVSTAFFMSCANYTLTQSEMSMNVLDNLYPDTAELFLGLFEGGRLLHISNTVLAHKLLLYGDEPIWAS